MSPEDTIRNAIAVLEDQHAAADGESKPEQTWHAEHSRKESIIVDGDGNPVATQLSSSDARLIVTMHRTIRPQLEMLHDTLRALDEVGPIVAGGDRHRHSFTLAHSILEEGR